MTDPRTASGKSLGDRLIELERRLAALEAAAGAGLLGTDQTIKGSHDRLDTLFGAGNDAADGKFWLGANLTRGVFVKDLADNVATSVFRITTTDESGDNDGGVWTCLVHVLVANGYAPINGVQSVKGLLVQFGRAIRNSGATGVCSAVTEICETASGATSAANRDVGAVTVTANEVSEYAVDVQIQADGTGSTAVAMYAVCSVELLWAGFLTAPTLTQV